MKSYAILDRLDPSLLQRAERMARAGVDYIQLRAKDRPRSERAAFAQQLSSIVRGSGTRLIINGDVELAREVDAGVHFTATQDITETAPSPRGKSCHSLLECAAVASTVDYVLLGPVYAPRSKAGEAQLTSADLSRAARLSVDVFALGGISVDTLADVAATGVAGVAAITLFERDEPLEQIVARIRDL